MTITDERPALWTSLPGWGIAADLIPPELINARKLKVLRKLIAAALFILLLVGAGGFYLVERENANAQSDLASVANETLRLQNEGRAYADVVSIQGSVSLVKAQIAQVMAGDVDLVALLTDIQSNLPPTMTIGQETVTISTAAVAATDSSTAGSVLDLSGVPRIGTITMTGGGATLDDLADYADRLRALPGLVDVIPVVNTAAEADPAAAADPGTTGTGTADPGTTQTSTTYSISMAITNVRLSHRFDVGTR